MHDQLNISKIICWERCKMDKSFGLASGKNCRLLRVRKELIPNYYVLAFPVTQGEPSPSEVTEMMNLGISRAKELALEVIGDKEAFSILYSGYSSRREKGWHIHIVLLGSRWKKAWLYMILSGKNVVQALGLRKDDAPRAI
jgi:hypothetical protein